MLYSSDRSHGLLLSRRACQSNEQPQPDQVYQEMASRAPVGGGYLFLFNGALFSAAVIANFGTAAALAVSGHCPGTSVFRSICGS